MMPKKSSIKFISGFLIPNLDSGLFGNRLKWLDKEKKIFQIDWCHKGGPKWTEGKAAVFVEWDITKGHYHPEDKLYFTKSKQRFRALLYKLTKEGRIIPLKSKEKFTKVYSIDERAKRTRKSSYCDSSEYEFCEEAAVISEDLSDSLDSYGICKRRVSKDSTTNILEDHAYVPVGCLRSSNSDAESDQTLVDLGYNFPTSTSLYDPIESYKEINHVPCNQLENNTVPFCMSEVIEDIKGCAIAGIHLSDELRSYTSLAVRNCEINYAVSDGVMVTLNHENVIQNLDLSHYLSSPNTDLPTELFATAE